MIKLLDSYRTQLFTDHVPKEVKHVSFSSLKKWKECPFRYMLEYIYEIDKFEGNIHTVFGTAVHGTMELLYGAKQAYLPIPSNRELRSRFDLLFELECDNLSIDASDRVEFANQGHRIVPLVYDRLVEEFGPFDVVSIEEELYEDIENTDIKYKGFIDMVIRLASGKYVILDWKTTSYGWNRYKRMDYYGTLMQSTLYKYYWCKKHGVALKDVQTYFVLLKRTVKDPSKCVEFFKVSNGPKSIDKALKVVKGMVTSLKNDMYPKLRSEKACRYCQYKEGEYCN